MRRLAVLAGLGLAVLAVGCLPLRPKPASPDPSPNVTTQVPSAAELVQYMNDNAALVQSVKSTEVEISAKQGSESIGLTGQLFCQKPLNFRLRAVLAGQPTVDIGSNDNEFWYWISQAKDEDNVARVHYCSYQDMAAGKARMPFPFQPDMIVSALGLGAYDPKGKYTVKDDAKTISLIEQTVSAQGQPVQRVTVFNRMRVKPDKPQVLAYLLLDDKGGEDLPGVHSGSPGGPGRSRCAGGAAAAGGPGLEHAAENRVENAAVPDAGQRHRRPAGGEALQPRRPAVSVVQPRAGIGRAQGLLAGDVDPAHQLLAPVK